MRAVSLSWMCLFALACGSSGGGGKDVSLPDAPDLALPDPGPADVATPDPAAETAGDPGSTPDPGSDLGTNLAPAFGKIDPVTLDMGTSTTVDLNPLLSDDQDPKASLVLSWSAKHVALQDPGTHVVYVVAPTAWSGTETIDLTVMDSGGLKATSSLSVTVKEVKVDPPKPPVECGKITFSYPAGTGSHTVLLSGSFNSWAKTAPDADVLADPDGDGKWTVDRVLQPGVYQYKFIVDGDWKPDPANPNQTPDGFGGINSVIQVAPCPT
jgi:hypothetical protein